ncbi:hypothetical protein GCM10009760_45630 [Kitasatospora kazusensis]|uniref:Uncharacterized protein n=1 Tax=Kitasatospora kazusensis TaxID=407974 RepID=A0ABN2ZZL8_9ACTN
MRDGHPHHSRPGAEPERLLGDHPTEPGVGQYLPVADDRRAVRISPDNSHERVNQVGGDAIVP